MIEELWDRFQSAYKKNRRLFLIGVGLSSSFVLLLGIVLFLIFHQTTPNIEQKLETSFVSSSLVSTTQSNEDRQMSSSSETVIVDIKGAVKIEGVYEVRSNERLAKVIDKAGGFTEDADKTSVNLAQKVSDEMMVYVARQDENKSLLIANSSSSATISDSTFGIVNINTATQEELQTISGIGEKRAKDIVAYREQNGLFKSVDELSNISGIGTKTLEKLKSEVSID